MSFFIALTATNPTAPTITGLNVGNNIQINLITPSTESRYGIVNYELWFAITGNALTKLISLLPGQFPYTWTGGTQGTSYNFALRGIDGSSQHEPSPFSNTVTLLIPAGPPPGNTYGIGVGQPYATIQAFLNAAQPGWTGQVYNGDYAGFTTVRVGSPGLSIVVQAAPGQSPRLMGSVTNGGTFGFVQIHDYTDLGRGIVQVGPNPGTTVGWQAAHGPPIVPPERGGSMRASNCYDRFDNMNDTQGWSNIPNPPSVQYTRIAYDSKNATISGTLDQGDASHTDAADGLENFINPVNSLSPTFMRFTNLNLTMGGHSSAQIAGTNVIMRTCYFDSNWTPVFGSGYGQKGADFYCFRDDVRNVAFTGTGRQTDQSTTTASVCYSNNGLRKRSFYVGSQSVTGMIGVGTNTFKQPGGSDCRFAHLTVDGFSSMGFQFGDLKVTPTFMYGPFYVKNVLVTNCANNPTPGKAEEAAVVAIEYQSSRGGSWITQIFFDTCGFSSATNLIYIIDTTTGSIILNQPLSYFIANFPANFANCVIGDPNYVSRLLPSYDSPVNRLAVLQAGYLPQNPAFLGTGTNLTTISNAVTNSTTVKFTDAKWFSDGQGWSDIPGDTCYIQNNGVRHILSISTDWQTVILDAPVTTVGGEKIYDGTSATPNIGAV